MFALNRPRMDAVALIVMTMLPFTGVITVREALSGFSDPNIVLIAALFVLGDGLVRTGVVREVGDWLVVKGGSSEKRLIPLLMIAVCGIGATMSSTAVAAIFIPVALRMSRGTGIGPGRLMMPVSIAALISGMTTLLATPPNLIVNAELIREGETGFHFFSFTPFGIPVLVMAIGWTLFARRWLPSDGGEPAEDLSRPKLPDLKDWMERYDLQEREYRFQIGRDSPLAGYSLRDLNLRSRAGMNILAIRHGRTFIAPMGQTELRVGDIMLVDLVGRVGNVDELYDQYNLHPLPLAEVSFTDPTQDLGAVEVIIPADSALVGHTIRQSAFRGKFGLTVIGIRRGVKAEKHIRDVELKVGDTLLVMGSWKSIRALRHTAGHDLVALGLSLGNEHPVEIQGRSREALLILALVVGLMITGIVPNVQAALIGCLLMGALGCVDLDSSYRAIDWKTMVLIVGMLPFSIALERTGGVDLASHALMMVMGKAGIHALLAALFIVTSVLGMFISNTATAVLMAPVAISVARGLEASPYPFAMIVALAASAAFMTPVSSPVNAIVVTPGGYRFGDFVRIGVPLTLLVMAISVLLVPALLPP
ncbi:MAG: SLC13 family permease [Gemmatimonadota bacterium]|jgi:di/tricarboxylate transporter|nr:SLC13 family permease [Gemmatimonadota bacterium]